MGYRSVTSVDGTRLRAWDNDGHGVPVLISNGLDTPHHAWPDINRRTDTYRVMTWDHRGLGGSERPSDESRISISDHTDDLFAVMDSYGVDRAVAIGWSAGVNVAFEAAVRQPQRIAGVLAVGGVPGGPSKPCFIPSRVFCARGPGGWARATAALPVPFDVANRCPTGASSGAGTIDFGFTALYDVAGERMSKILACLNPAVAAGQLGSGAPPARSSMSVRR